MMIYALVTGEYITEESAAEGDAEERGWVDPSWSMTVFHESRNDVEPVFKERTIDTGERAEPEYDEDFIDRLEEVLHHWGPFDVEDDKSERWLQGVTEHADYENGGSRRYSLHFVAKYYGDKGWTERVWHPSEAGVSIR